MANQSPTGFAKLNKAKKINGSIALASSPQGALILKTDSISKIKNLDHTTFTIPVKLASKYAISFQNLIIDIEKDKTTAFLLTYHPDQTYKQKIHEGKKPYFTGRISRKPFDLNTLSATAIASTSNSTTGVVCTTTTYISGVREVLCDGNGHHYVGDPEPCTANNPAHYEFAYSTSLDCVYEGGDSGTPPGDGGGGGSNPPANDPPPNTPIIISNSASIVPTLYGWAWHQ